MNPIRIVLMTAPIEDAPRLARALVDEYLAACVNILPPMQSVYRWEGRVEEASEVLLIIKTPLDRVQQLMARAMELHPYAVPELLTVEVDYGIPGYLKWVYEATRGGSDAASADR